MLVYIKNLASWGVLGIGALIALPAYSQITPITPINRNSAPFNQPNTQINQGNRRNTLPGSTILNRPVIQDRPLIQVTPGLQNSSGTTTSYPYGSRISNLGGITTPTGQVIYPTVGTDNGDGTTTYRYSNGAQITVDKNKLPASGAFLR